ncbi:hypothetical protein RND71_027825 [Anisodus tanguticus]|uniref:Leucine-rich repeat-containing N-terminal plant-type domain-containing protein n=1 Tax=Anisodus tanguticus TaxID=243964 RepID=A0AAE1RKC7_9SOLA|nr:hypothetical protein RND71_027825 [Anisodus tanguticus]
MAGVLCPMLQLLWTCWILMYLNFMGCSGKLVAEEKRALLELRDSLNYPNGSTLINEWVEEDYCAWAGIFCIRDQNYDARVLEIFLTSKRELGLGIWYPDATLLTRFTHLRSLYVSGNAIGNWIMPEALCKLRNLKELDLSFNPLNGDALPHFQVCSLTSLEQLHLSGVYPSFPLPLLRGYAEIRSNLSSNNLTDDSMPPCLFDDLSYLESLDLSGNNLKNSHHILSGICKFRNLQVLNLQDNLIQGGLDQCLGGMTSLVSLDLSFNHFDGTVSSSIFNNLTLLENLRFSDNRFDGLLLFASFANLSMLEAIDLTNNEFEVDTENSILGNRLSGGIPVSSQFQASSLLMLDVSDNCLGSTLPTNVLKLFPDLFYLNLSNNALEVLPAALLNLPVLKVMDISGNYMSGVIPDYFPLFPNLAILLLARNQFHGIIPVSLCQMQKLHILDLSANFLFGVLPSCLGNITGWKKESEVLLPAFKWLSPTYTNYRVKVPLTTKGNAFSYEGIPLSQMTTLDLSMNHFTSEIPSHLGKLAALHSLNLSHNILSGHIPESFMNLKSLESLDLSYNHLIGKIPPQMTQPDSLSTLNLAFNNLSGRIPSGNKFVTFAASSYRGNKELCGLPLGNDCAFSSSPQQHQEEEEEEEEEEEKQGIGESDLFFFSCIAVAYGVGFWSVIAPLLLSRNWRRTYYAKVDSCFELCEEKLHLL